MRRRSSHFFWAWFAALAAGTSLVATCGLSARAPAAPPGTNAEKPKATVPRAFDDIYARMEKTPHGFRVKERTAKEKPGTKQIARRGDFEEAKFREMQKEYYDQIARDLGLKSADEPSTLDQLLALCGYAGLAPEDLEKLESSVLMDPAKLAAAVKDPAAFGKLVKAHALQPDDILAAGFFSAKTTDVSRPGAIEYSWRKLTRLKLRPDAPAYKSGVGAIYVLGNIYNRDLSQNPFANYSKNVQVILVRREGGKLSQPLYWMIFGSAKDGSPRVDYSVTSWDANNSPDVDAVNSRYYAPFACIQCHGWDSANARLNPLDLDYWLDKTEPGNDFEAVGKSAWSSVFDGGKDSTSPQFAAAFEVVRKLNAEILAQNELVDKELKLEEPAFQTRAVKNWLEIHAGATKHLPPPQRGVSSANGKVKWREDSAVEAELVTLLDRYCYRCHSSLLYNVFDKEMVLKRRDTMLDFLDLEVMPLDRKLDAPVKARLIELLKQIAPAAG